MGILHAHQHHAAAAAADGGLIKERLPQHAVHILAVPSCDVQPRLGDPLHGRHIRRLEDRAADVQVWKQRRLPSSLQSCNHYICSTGGHGEHTFGVSRRPCRSGYSPTPDRRVRTAVCMNETHSVEHQRLMTRAVVVWHDRVLRHAVRSHTPACAFPAGAPPPRGAPRTCRSRGRLC